MQLQRDIGAAITCFVTCWSAIRFNFMWYSGVRLLHDVDVVSCLHEGVETAIPNLCICPKPVSLNLSSKPYSRRSSQESGVIVSGGGFREQLNHSSSVVSVV